MFPGEIEKTVTLRLVKGLDSAELTRRGLVRWLAISLGLLGPRDSRETVVDILDFLFQTCLSEGRDTSIEEIASKTGVQRKLVYYHVAKLEELGLVEHRRGRVMLRTGLRGEPDLSRLRATINECLSRSELAMKELWRFYRG